MSAQAADIVGVLGVVVAVAVAVVRSACLYVYIVFCADASR